MLGGGADMGTQAESGNYLSGSSALMASFSHAISSRMTVNQIKRKPCLAMVSTRGKSNL